MLFRTIVLSVFSDKLFRIDKFNELCLFLSKQRTHGVS